MTSVFKYRGGDWPIVKRDLLSLAKNEIFAAPFESLNDPFEAMAVIDGRSFEIGSLMLRWPSPKTPDQINAGSLKFTTAVDQFVQFTKGVGVYSLSGSVMDELLWAHYGNSHKGFCLEFDLEQLLTYKLEAEEVLTVEYVPQPPKISMVSFVAETSSKEKLLQKLIATKSCRWEYEKETRICVGKAGLREYDYRALKAVYFGVRCERRLIRLAMRLLRGRGVRYYQMQLVKDSYQLQAVEVDDEFSGASPYRGSLARLEDGIPFLDEKTRPYVAIELARREPYCEKIMDAYISGSRGTPESPVFYVTYERSDGNQLNLYYTLQEVRDN